GLSMVVAGRSSTYTLDEFLKLPDRELFELVDGQLVVMNSSNLSSLVAGKLLTRIGTFNEANKQGEVFPADSYFQCFPDLPGHARKPDVSFIRLERLPVDWLEDGYFTIAPDLAVEVISPGDRAEDVEEKIREYLSAGVSLVWEIYPQQRVAYVHRAD